MGELGRGGDGETKAGSVGRRKNMRRNNSRKYGEGGRGGETKAESRETEEEKEMEKQKQEVGRLRKRRRWRNKSRKLGEGRI